MYAHLRVERLCHCTFEHLHIFIVIKFKFLKLNQRISASVQVTPRRGNEHIAQGIALGMMKR